MNKSLKFILNIFFAFAIRMDASKKTKEARRSLSFLFFLNLEGKQKKNGFISSCILDVGFLC